MPVAHFAHEDAPAFLQYFRINDSWLFSKTSDLMLAAYNCLCRFAVAIGTQRRRFSGHTQFRLPSLCHLEQRSRRPLWCGRDSRSQYGVNRLKDFPAYICNGTKGVSLGRKHRDTSVTVCSQGIKNVRRNKLDTKPIRA